VTVYILPQEDKQFIQKKKKKEKTKKNPHSLALQNRLSIHSKV